MMWTVLLGTLLAPANADLPLEVIGRLAEPSIREASGIVASRRHPGVFWVHNDSANPPRLFAVDARGSLIRQYALNVPNVDWEDLAIDSRGHLFLGDIGNNDARLPLRVIHQLDEPDPTTPLETRRSGVPSIRVTTSSYYRFGETGRFDAEALVIDGRRALVTAKTFDRREAEVFAVPLDPPAPLLKPAVAERVGRLPGFTWPVTGADLSRDGTRLVVCATGALGIYQREANDRWKRLNVQPFAGDGRVEAVAWDGNDVILASEGRTLYRVREADWAPSQPVPATARSSRDRPSSRPRVP